MDHTHPLHGMLCDLPRESTRRLHVAPLSRDSVNLLAAETGRRVDGLYERTGGNPFLVVELLSAPGSSIPQNVAARVCAGLQKASEGARAAAELTCVVPGRVDLIILESALGCGLSAVDECMSRGLLVIKDGSASFRHEILREALFNLLPPEHRRSLHGRMLDAMLACGNTEIVVMLHQAILAQRHEIVLKYAPRAAQEASARGAHREAVRLYEAALLCVREGQTTERMALLEPLAQECMLVGNTANAIELRCEQLALARAHGDKEVIVHVLCAISRLQWVTGRRRESEVSAEEAIALAVDLPDSSATAWVLATRAQLHAFAGEVDRARELGERARQMANRLGSQDIRASVLSAVDAACEIQGDHPGSALLEQSLLAALAAPLEEHAVIAWSIAASTALRSRDLAGAQRAIEAGLAYCTEHDLLAAHALLLGWRAQVLTMRGEWNAGRADAEMILARTELPVPTRLPALIAIAALRVRCGDKRALEALEEIDYLTQNISESTWRLPLAVLFGEYAYWAALPKWADHCRRIAAPWRNSKADQWFLCALHYWLVRMDPAEASIEAQDGPWSMLQRGEVASAARAFQNIGRRYEAALALAGGSVEQQLAALAEFEVLGAAPAANHLRRTLRRRGVRSLSRGPRPSTRANPAGLTRRELEVLHLLGHELSDSMIARQLFLSVKTVGHHVSRILAKFDIHSRREAVKIAKSRGIIGAAAESHGQGRSVAIAGGPIGVDRLGN